MKKYYLLIVLVVTVFCSTLLAQNNKFNQIELRFKDGEVLKLDLENRDDKRLHDAILQGRWYEVDYRKNLGNSRYQIVPEMPEFNKGVGDLKTYISENLVYPKEAREQKQEAIVYTSFVINKLGKIASASISRGVGPGFDREALRIINSLPEWTPGRLDGKTVDVYCTIPIIFNL